MLLYITSGMEFQTSIYKYNSDVTIVGTHGNPRRKINGITRQSFSHIHAI